MWERVDSLYAALGGYTFKRVTESVGAYMCFRCDGVVEVKPKPKSIKHFFDKHLSWSGKELDKHDQ